MNKSFVRASFRSSGRALLASLLVFGVGAASAQAAPDKAALHQQMLELQNQIEIERRSSGSSASPRSATLATELQAISNQLGGDLPCAVGPSVAGIAAALGGPPLPGNCAPVSTTASNTTAVVLDGGPSTVTSTIVVSGAAPYLWELSLTTFIRHTFSADLDITLQSPAGTVVTLTTDNGGGNDDVFNGTVWSDRANPGGQVPYTANDGLVTDHVYANLTLASPLVPEESLAAFAGEDPNGTWTLTISDDAAGDGGALDQWSLSLVGFAQAPVVSAPQSFANTTALPVPTGPAVVSSTIAVSGQTNAICGLTVNTNLAHTFSSDLDITLQSPSGTVVTLTTDNGGGNDDVFAGTVWRDNANPGGQVPYSNNDGMVTDQLYANLSLASPLVVEESLGAFRGEDANGTWTLTISDDAAGDGGTLSSWSLDLVTCTCAQPADMGISLSAAPSPVIAGAGFALSALATNNGPGPAEDVAVSVAVPAGATLSGSSASAGGSCSGSGPVLCTWAGATALGVGRTATLNLIAPGSPGTLAASASVSANSADPVASNNAATLAVAVGAAPTRPAVVSTLQLPGLLLLVTLVGMLGLLMVHRAR